MNINAIEYVVLSDLTNAAELNQAFSDTYRRENQPSKMPVLYASFIETALGAMLSVADDKAIHMLEFFDRRSLVKEIKKLVRRSNTWIAPGMPEPMRMLEKELNQYFLGKLKKFSTPVKQFGTPFQIAAWKALEIIPYGQTRSYQEQALAVGNPLAHRAVANANSCNQIAVVIPCHRIIKSDGSLGGYGGRPTRKKWLLDLEKGHRL